MRALTQLLICYFSAGKLNPPLRAGGICPLRMSNIVGLGQVSFFWTRAYRNLRAARNRVAHRYNKGRKAHLFKVGDTVMYKKQ